MNPVALLDALTLDSIVFDGATSTTVVHDGSVTNHPTPDRSFVSDGPLQRPRTASIEAIMSPRHLLDGEPMGFEGVNRLLARLDVWKAEGRELLLQRPRRPLLDLMVVQSWRETQNESDGLGVSIQLKQVRIASTSTSQTQLRRGKPTAAFASGLTKREELGEGTTKPAEDPNKGILAGFVDTTTSFLDPTGAVFSGGG